MTTIHTAIDALLDDLLWEAGRPGDSVFDRNARSDEIARIRAQIHDAVRGLSAARGGAPAEEQQEWRCLSGTSKGHRWWVPIAPDAPSDPRCPYCGGAGEPTITRRVAGGAPAVPSDATLALLRAIRDARAGIEYQWKTTHSGIWRQLLTTIDALPDAALPNGDEPVNRFSRSHPHEPAIPVTEDADGRCLICTLLVERDEARKRVRELDVAAPAVSRGPGPTGPWRVSVRRDQDGQDHWGVGNESADDWLAAPDEARAVVIRDALNVFEAGAASPAKEPHDSDKFNPDGTLRF